MSKFTYLTKEGYIRLRDELSDLKSNGRKAAAQAIAEAREKGDLSENAEYDAAKDAQGMLEMKISELEGIMSNARIIDESLVDTSRVAILSNVQLKNLKTNKTLSIKLVSETEADAKKQWISVTSPIGSGILGKNVGDKAKIITPGGAVEFEVLDISFG